MRPCQAGNPSGCCEQLENQLSKKVACKITIVAHTSNLFFCTKTNMEFVWIHLMPIFRGPMSSHQAAELQRSFCDRQACACCYRCNACHLDICCRSHLQQINVSWSSDHCTLLAKTVCHLQLQCNPGNKPFQHVSKGKLGKRHVTLVSIQNYKRICRRCVNGVVAEISVFKTRQNGTGSHPSLWLVVGSIFLAMHHICTRYTLQT